MGVFFLIYTFLKYEDNILEWLQRRQERREMKREAMREGREIKKSQGVRLCPVCGYDSLDSYIVHSQIWDAARLTAEDQCHIKCLPERLGRELNLSDFDTLSPFNRLLILGYRMGRRLGESGDIPDLP